MALFSRLLRQFYPSARSIPHHYVKESRWIGLNLLPLWFYFMSALQSVVSSLPSCHKFCCNIKARFDVIIKVKGPNHRSWPKDRDFWWHVRSLFLFLSFPLLHLSVVLSGLWVSVLFCLGGAFHHNLQVFSFWVTESSETLLHRTGTLSTLYSSGFQLTA